MLALLIVSPSSDLQSIHRPFLIFWITSVDGYRSNVFVCDKRVDRERIASARGLTEDLD